MGVTKIQSRYVKPLLIAGGGSHTSAPKDVSTVCVDATASIYAAVANVCGYGNRPEATLSNAKQLATQEIEGENVTVLDMKVIDETLRILQSFVSSYPAKFYYFGMDGRVPSMKLNQQRTRRWLSAKQRENVNQDDAQAALRSIFDTTKITPGTPFMEVFDREFMKRFPDRGMLEGDVTVVYSPYRDVGEGEHKIIAFLRSPLVPKDGSHVIVSADSDMIVLASTLSLENVYVYRDSLNIWVSIDRLKYSLRTLYGVNARMDAVQILQLLGNDFVPPQPSFLPGPDGQVMPPTTEKEGRVPSLFEVYRDVGMSIVTMDEGKVVIDWNSFRQVLEELAKDEYRRLSSVALHANAEDPRWTNAIFDKTGNKDHFEDFRAAWYGRALEDVAVEDRPEEIKNMVSEYLRSIAWTVVYYLEGRADSDFVYTYRYAPLLYDIVSFTWSGDYEKEMSVTEEEYLIHIPDLIEQDLVVIPTPDPESVFGIIHDVDREVFPEPSNITIDTLGLSVTTDDAEVVAVQGLPCMNSSRISEVTSPEYLNGVNEDEIGEAIISLFTKEGESDRFTARPTLVMEKRAPLRQQEARQVPRTKREPVPRKTTPREERVEKEAPAKVPAKAPAKAPVKAPVKAPAKAPVKAPTKK